LLEAIAHRCGIHIWRDSERRRFENNPFEGRLADCISVEWADRYVPGSFYGSAVFQDFARILDEWVAADPGQLKYWGGKSLMTQSHGQSTMSYFKARYQIEGLYLLDEPETALSARTQLDFLRILVEASRAGQAQFILATHSPILLACPGATIYSFDQAPIRPVLYEATEHYQIYKSFMANRQDYLSTL
jgi:predicted ATPase